GIGDAFGNHAISVDGFAGDNGIERRAEWVLAEHADRERVTAVNGRVARRPFDEAGKIEKVGCFDLVFRRVAGLSESCGYQHARKGEKRGGKGPLEQNA